MNTILTQQEIEENRKGRKRFIFYMILCLMCFCTGIYAGAIYYKHQYMNKYYQEGYDKAIKDIKSKLNEKEELRNSQVI